MLLQMWPHKETTKPVSKGLVIEDVQVYHIDMDSSKLTLRSSCRSRRKTPELALVWIDTASSTASC